MADWTPASARPLDEWRPQSARALDPEPTSSAAGTVLHQGLQGLTQGFSDELGGLGTAALQGLTNLLPKSAADKLGLVQAPAMDAYRFSRDEERKLLAKQEQEHPELAMGSKIAGGIASGMALPMARVGSGAAGLIGSGALTGAGYGALAGLGSSDADLTQGDTEGALKDTVKGAAIGGALGAAGGALGAGASRLSDFAEGKLSGALEKRAAMASKNIDKQGATLAGQLGGETQKGSRTIEYLLDREAQGALTPEEQAGMDELRKSGQWDKLVRGVTKAKLADAPIQLGKIEAKATELSDFNANKEALLAKEAERISSPEEAMRQIGERVKRYGPVWAGGIAAKALGTAEGPGFLAGAGIRPGLKAVGRMLQHPSVEVPVYRAMGKVGQLLQSNPEALGKFGGALASITEQHGPEAAAAAHFVMQQTNPEYQRLAQEDK